MSMKSYLRIEPRDSFGVITSPQCNLVYDNTGNLALCGAGSKVIVWNMRTGISVSHIEPEFTNYPFTLPGDVCVLCISPDRSTMAAGYSTGEVRLLNYIKGSVHATFRGHSTSVRSLCYAGITQTNSTGQHLLASGGSDCDIIIWDTVALCALYKLRGHKGPVTSLSFLRSNYDVSSREFLVSASTDTLVKVWDLSSQSCVQTIVGHRSEVWSLCLLYVDVDPDSVIPSSTSSEDNNGKSEEKGGGVEVIVTGCVDEYLRGYVVDWRAVNTRDSFSILKYIGAIKRDSGGNDRCTTLSKSHSGLLAAQSNGKNIDIFRQRSSEECMKKYKKRRKKETKERNSSSSIDKEGRDKVKDTGAIYSQWNEEDPVDISTTPSSNDNSISHVGVDQSVVDHSNMILSDILDTHTSIRCSSKIKSIDFRSTTTSGGGGSGLRASGAADNILVGMINNTIETYAVPVNSSGSSVNTSRVAVIDHQGHRSDVRGVCVSYDGSLIASCSAEGVKIWSGQSYQALRSCKSGYALCLQFAPGGQYLVVGTKEGTLQVIDGVSGHLVDTYDAHTAEIWNICVSPDLSSFMTCSGDKNVKFWSFDLISETDDNGVDIVNANGETRDVMGVKQSRIIEMTHDALCCCYSPVKDASKRMVAVGLLDNTIKVFYDDSLKFYLSLYGHKLPVTAVDISTDGTLLVSGSADKTIKIWGMDFGDCHRSLYGHTDSITCIHFQAHTHYCYSGDKKGMLKYWDIDR
jgi:U3 small nucleolar RNA-associated protein 12